MEYTRALALNEKCTYATKDTRMTYAYDILFTSTTSFKKQVKILLEKVNLKEMAA